MMGMAMSNYKDWRGYWVSNIPETKFGTVSVQKFKVSEEEAALFNIRASFSFGSRGGYIQEGEYTKLLVNDVLWMSDTPSEYSDHMGFFVNAKGNILINGLGLGCSLGVVSNIEGVNNITVVELNSDVISVVGSYWKEKLGDRLTIVHADALEWKSPKGVKYDTVWHDIWAHISPDNYEEMKKLKRRYAQKSGWQGVWRYESAREGK